MNSKRLIVCLTFLALIAFSAYSVKIHNLNHNSVRPRHETGSHKHMVEKSIRSLNYRLSQAFHLDDDSGMPSYYTDLFDLFLNDQDILDSIMNGTPLSQAGQDKIKNFFTSNEQFNQDMIDSFNADDSPQCLKDLSEDQQRKLVTITIQQMDFAAIIGGQTTPDDDVDAATEDKIRSIISDDSDLGPDVAECFIDNKQTVEDLE